MKTAYISTCMRTLDAVLIESRAATLIELRQRLTTIAESQMAADELNAREILEITRGVLERLLIGAIQRAESLATCLGIYHEVANLGYDNPVQEWLITHPLLQYLSQRQTIADDDALVSLLDGLHRQLLDLREGAEESLQQLQVFRTRE